jgi:diguanylate cyclase (GGDEF)-like protein
VISLKKYLDGLPWREKSRLDQYSELLLEIAHCADRAVPNLEIELTPKMNGLKQELKSTETIVRVHERARVELAEWADAALAHHQGIERELREMVNVITAAAASVRGRDAKYAKEISDLSVRLSSIAEEKEIAPMRRSIVESTRALKDCVTRMAAESKASVNQLTAEMREYRVRLEEAERVSETDTLTNLANRRAFERHLEYRIAEGKPFCIAVLDLNGFKSVNDRFGHLAGDDLLKQFAAELKARFNFDEMVARWGGDEFVIVLEGGLAHVQARIDRMRKWSLGDYQIRHKERTVTVFVNASIGIAEWDGHENGLGLLARADREVYRAKRG